MACTVKCIVTDVAAFFFFFFFLVHRAQCFITGRQTMNFKMASLQSSKKQETIMRRTFEMSTVASLGRNTGKTFEMIIINTMPQIHNFNKKCAYIC